MFNNSIGRPQAQITSTSYDSSNWSSKTPNETPSSRSALELDATLHEDLLTDSRNQGHGQPLVRGTYGYPIPLLPVYTNFWNGASWFPGPSTGNTAGHSSGRGTTSGYPSALTYCQPMPPNFESGQTSEHRGMFHGGHPPVAVVATNPVPDSYTTHPPRPSASAYPIPNSQRESAAVWHSHCWINRAERDEIHMTIVLRRSPLA
ncbi:hypothetical protein EDB87DRAFT_1683188 [Lactarius vividus]|nr:hypothetical protein EDB87DRAFT_1683188 [Lactarius vividus]